MGNKGSKGSDSGSPQTAEKASEAAGAKFQIGKMVTIEAPRSLGPPLSELKGQQCTVKSSRVTSEGRVYTLIKNNYIGNGDIQTVEVKEEYLQRGGVLAQSQDVKFLTVRNTFKACKVYRIPTFQRRYCWAEFQWRKLWQSIETVRDNPQMNNHSMQRLMLLQRSDGSRLVLDGQQRLTTMSVLLAALCDRLAALGDRESEAEYRQFCTEGRLIVTMDDRPDFRRCLVESSPSGDASNVRAKCCFTELAKELDGDACIEMIEATLDRLSFTVFVLDNEDMMQSVFEKMAFRTEVVETMAVDLYSCIDCYAAGDGGKEVKATHWGPEGERLCADCAAKKPGSCVMTPGIPMSPVDVIRNFVFDHYSGDDAMVKAYNAYWGPMEHTLGEDTKCVEAGLKAFLTSKGIDVDTRWGLNVSFKTWWGKPSSGTSSVEHADAKLIELRDGVQSTQAA